MCAPKSKIGLILIGAFLLIGRTTLAQSCISHRGILPGVPENSLEALRRVNDLELPGVEFDIQMTKDGEPILYHDSKIGHGLEGGLCPQGKKIKKLNYHQLQSSCFLENGEKLPHLKDALIELKNYSGFIFIDLKKVPSRKFYKIMEDSGLLKHKKLRFISFKKRALRPIRRRWPQVKRTLLSRYIPRGLFYEGIGFNKRLSLFAKVFNFLGKNVSLWTLNEREDMEKAIQKGADFIITDEIDLCLDLITQRSQE